MTTILRSALLGAGLLPAWLVASGLVSAAEPMCAQAVTRLASYSDGGNANQSKRPPAPGVKVAAGDECPNLSGSFCPDEAPVCCLVSGEWKCFAKLEDCKEE
jgi:hypothetical protein